MECRIGRMTVAMEIPTGHGERERDAAPLKRKSLQGGTRHASEDRVRNREVNRCGVRTRADPVASRTGQFREISPADIPAGRGVVHLPGDQRSTEFRHPAGGINHYEAVGRRRREDIFRRRAPVSKLVHKHLGCRRSRGTQERENNDAVSVIGHCHCRWNIRNALRGRHSSMPSAFVSGVTAIRPHHSSFE